MSWPDPRPLRILVIRYRFIGDTVLAIQRARASSSGNSSRPDPSGRERVI